MAELYTRLDAERARVKIGYAAALRSPIDMKDGGTLVQRDSEVRALAKETRRLGVADNGLCFGRLDSLSGERSYIGRIGIFDKDNDYETLLTDWRAPAAQAFYTATGANPEGMRRRRQFHTRSRTVVAFTDELLGRPEDAERGGSGDAALLAAVNAPRGDGMRDIVATIQSEQDEIIRLDHPGVLVIEGGPGTGKTVVALHRVAYLLYTQRRRIENHGVLVVGPNSAFLNHIGRVLPSLGETDVVFMTTGDLVPGLHVTADDSPEAARAKGSLEMLEVLAAAVADRQRLPEDPIPIKLADVTVHIDSETAEWARDEARGSGLPHNEARAKFIDIVTYVLTERAIARIGRGWLTREDRKAWEQLRSDLLKDLADNASFTAAIDDLWPILTPESLLATLYSSAERLRAAGADEALLRAEGSAWTVPDVPLLDELVDLLGPDKPADDSAERERKARSRVRRRGARHDGQPRGPDVRRGPPARHGPALRRRPCGSFRSTRHQGTRRARGRGPGLDLSARRGRRGAGTLRDGLAGADAALPESLVHGGRRPRAAPLGRGRDVVGFDARTVCTRALGLPVADGELSHPGRDHVGRGRAACGVRARASSRPSQCGRRACSRGPGRSPRPNWPRPSRISFVRRTAVRAQAW